MVPPTKQLRFLHSAAILRGEESVIGRSDYSSILIAHPSVSRVHASITQREGKTFIQDLGSRNHTFVNGQQVGETPVPIDIGDTIRIGTVDCIVETTSDNAGETTDNCPELRDRIAPRVLKRKAPTDES
jgi:pSer/pThr/pTyr-binding forkhead associated (FHA) protein